MKSGKANGQYKTKGFQAFPNRCCYTCEAAWTPACPKWAGVACVLSGFAVWLLQYLLSGLSTIPGSNYLAGIFGLYLIIYGLSVLAGKLGKLRILSIGNFDFKTLDRPASK